MGGRYMTVDDTARIAIVLKKLDEARNRLYEATKIYEHMLDEKSTPLEYGMIHRNNGPLPKVCKIKEPEQCDD